MDPYLRNIRVYQKLLGVLYMQPYYLYKLLVCPQFTESDKVIALLQDLYINSSASPLKSIAYLIRLSLNLIEHEALLLISSGFRPRMIRPSFLKLYSMVNSLSVPVRKLQDMLKRSVIGFIIKYCQEADRKEIERKNQRRKNIEEGQLKEKSGTDGTPPLSKLVIQDRHSVKTKLERSCFLATL